MTLTNFTSVSLEQHDVYLWMVDDHETVGIHLSNAKYSPSFNLAVSHTAKTAADSHCHGDGHQKGMGQVEGTSSVCSRF